MNNDEIKYFLTNLVATLLKVLWIIPVDKNKIVFDSFGGKQYSDNPKYICEQICKNYPKKIMWVFINPEAFSYLKNSGYQLIKRNTFNYYYHMMTAGTIITNNHILSYIPIRKKQILLNTWHGGSPLKTVGFAEANCSSYYNYFFKLQNKKYTAMISSSKFMTEEVFGKSFHYFGTILEFGMPRNAILLGDHKDAIEKVYSHFNIDREQDVGIVLYAPTFRGDVNSSSFLTVDQQFSINKCINALQKRFNKKFYFLFRAHHAMVDALVDKNFICATDYPDMQELLCAADVLITDYSSCMGDMALMKKPVFLYTPDLEEYTRDRGFYWDIHSLPFPLSMNQDEFYKSIIDFNERDYLIGVDDYHTRLGSFETVNSTKKTVEWLENKWNTALGG